MRICVLLGFLFLSILLATFCSIVTVHAATTWKIQEIDQTTASVDGIALDTNNNPHIAYSDYENGNPRNPIDIMYASWTGSSWNTQTAVKGDPRENTDLDSFALDSHNKPAILYNAVYGATCAIWTGSNWTLQILDEEGSYGGSIAFDSAGNLHVAYKALLAPSNYPQGVTDNIAVLKYASWNGTNWNNQTVDSPVSYLDGISLAFDSNNSPHILYGYDTYDNRSFSTSVRYAVWNGSSWNTQTVLPNVLLYGDMALDSKGYLHFIYEENYLNTLAYATWNGSVCNSQAIISNSNPDMLSVRFLTMNAYDYPQFDFFNQSSKLLLYAAWTGNVWNIETVGPNSLALGPGPIAVDSKGNVHIAYPGVTPEWEVGIDSCMYATAVEPVYTPTPSPTPIPTANAVANIELFSLIAVPVLTAAVLVVVVYAWKKKTEKAHRQDTARTSE